MAASGTDLLADIAAILLDFADGTPPSSLTFVRTGTYTLGGVLTLTNPTLTFAGIEFEGAGPGTLYTGTVTVTAASASVGGPTALATLGPVDATYELSLDLPGQGAFSLTGSSLTLGLGTLASATASSVVLSYDVATNVFEIGATGVSLRVGPDAGPKATVSSGSLGLVVRAGGASPEIALLVTGDLSLTNGAGLTLSQPGWRFGYNELTDLDSTPVTVQTGLGDLTLDLADGVVALTGTGSLGLGSLGSISGSYVISTDGTTLTLTVAGGAATLTVGGHTLSLTDLAGSVTISGTMYSFGALSGAGVLTLGALGSVSGTFGVATTSGGLTLTASGLSAQLSAGPAVVTLTGGAGTVTMGSTGVTTTGVAGSLGLTGVPGLDLTGTPTLTFSTATSAFSLTGTGALRLAGLVDLAGTLTISASGVDAGRTITVALSGTGASGSVTITAAGAFSGTASAPLSLPVAVPGVTLSGTGALSFTGGNWSLAVTGASLTTPAGTLTGSLTITRAGDVLELTGTGLTLFVGDRRGSGATDDIGLTATVNVAARMLAGGALALRATGSVTTLGTVGFSGTFVAAYNPTDAALTLGGVEVAAQTTSVGGTLTLALPGGVSLTGPLALTRQGSGDTTVVTLTASGLTGTVGGPTGTLITLDDGQVELRITADTTSSAWALTASGAVTLTGAPAGFGIAGAISVALDSGDSTAVVTGAGLVITLGPVTVTGTLTVTASTGGVVTLTLAGGAVEVDGLASATGVGGTVVLGGTPSINLTATAVTLELGPATLTGGLTLDSVNGFRVTGATLTVGGQTLTGAFTVARTLGAVTISATGIGVTFGSIATISSGALTLTVSEDGVVGTLTATVAVSVGGLTIPSSTVTLTLDTTGPTPLVSLGVTLSAPVTLTGSLGQLTAGTLAIQRQGASTFVVGLSGLSATLSGGAGLTLGSGALVVSGSGLAGYLTGTVGGVTATVRMNTTGVVVDETIDVGGNPMRIVFGVGEESVFSVVLSGSLDFGPVSIEGTITWSTINGKQAFAGTGLTIFFGNGPLTLANGERNPLAVGVLVTDGTLGVVWDGVVGSTKYALDVSGTVSLVGVAAVELSGTVRVRYNNYDAAVDTTIPLGSGEVSVVFADATDVAQVTGTGLRLAVLGQEFTGNLTFARTSAGLSVTVSDLSATVTCRRVGVPHPERWRRQPAARAPVGSRPRPR